MKIRSQQALEYLATYGWAIVIIIVVIGVFTFFKVFNRTGTINNTCTIEAQFGCESLFLASNGLLTVTIEQLSSEPVNITAIGCNSNLTYANMLQISPQQTIPIDGNETFDVSCYSGSQIYSGTTGTLFSGYLILNYTNNVKYALPHTITGSLVLKVG